VNDDLTKCALQLEQLTTGLDPAARRQFFATLPSIADNVLKTAAQIIGPDPIIKSESSGGSKKENQSSMACPHCGNMLSVRLASK
jgi:hypothetical protein